MQRDSANRPALLGSSIKGSLRQTWCTFLQNINPENKPNLPLKTWLGEESNEGYKPIRARLHFSYWWSDLAWDENKNRHSLYRIKINEDTGVTEEGALQVIESPYPHGQEVTFSGTIHAWLTSQEELDQLSLWIRKGLRYSHMLGANKGLGFGRIKNVDVEATSLIIPTLTNHPPEERLGLRIHPQEPFCIGKPAVGENNRFDSEEYIPGAAILGALARAKDHNDKANWPLLNKHFDAIRVSHAVPAEASVNTRILALTLSISTFADSNGRTELLDLVDYSKSGWIKRYGHESAPCFQADWKDADWDKANLALKLPEVKKRLDVHTAINRGTGTAETGKLYSIEAVVPDKLSWLTNVDFSQITPEAERTQVCQEFLRLSALGLDGIGKLNTQMTVSPESWFDFTFPQRDLINQPLQVNDTIHLILQTPTLLLAPDLALPTSGGQDELEKAYRNTWEQLSSQSLKLKHFFTRHELRGGRYWFQRFRAPAQQSHYRPLIHTMPGSLFVLRVVDADQATEKLQDWQRYGLPQIAEAPGGENWQHNPWIRNNGYGEIAINPVMPFIKLPKGQWNEC